MSPGLAIGNVFAELLGDAKSEKAIPALAVGFTTGLGLLVTHIAFGSFIFSGPLAPYSSQGIGMVLFGCFAICLIISLGSGYRGAISGLSPALVVVMSAVGPTMDLKGDTHFITTAVTLMAGAFCAGACCLAIGHFRLANMVRFVPYPVAGGFVAGIGGIVCFAALSLMGAELEWLAVFSLFEWQQLAKWMPGALYGCVLYFAMKRWSNPLILPLSVVLFVVAYHLVLGAADISAAQARSAELLLAGTSDTSLWPPAQFANFSLIEIDAVIAQTPAILTLILISVIIVILNIAGLEMAVQRDLNWDREFRVTGAASVIGGCTGGTPGSLIVPASLRSKLFGADTRLTGIITAAVIAAVLFLGDGLLELIPTSLVGGVLIFAGLGMVDQGLVHCARRLPRWEYLIVVTIFIIVNVFGLFEGVIAGMAVVTVFFVVRLSRTDVITSVFSARERKSAKVRSLPERAILLKSSERLHGFELQGYIFFGSVYALSDRLGESVSADAGPNCILLDFSSVTGLDFSAVNVLRRFFRMADASGTKVVLSDLSGPVHTAMVHGLSAEESASFKIEADSDRAVEYCEQVIISAWKSDRGESGDGQGDHLIDSVFEGLDRQLQQQVEFEELLDEVKKWFARQTFAAGQVIFSGDEKSRDIHLLAAGRVSVYDAHSQRIRQLVSGDVIWPVDDQCSDLFVVRADEDCETYLLPQGDLLKMEKLQSSLAFRIYRHLLRDRFAPSRPAEF